MHNPEIHRPRLRRRIRGSLFGAAVLLGSTLGLVDGADATSTKNAVVKSKSSSTKAQKKQQQRPTPNTLQGWNDEYGRMMAETKIGAKPPTMSHEIFGQLILLNEYLVFKQKFPNAPDNIALWEAVVKSPETTRVRFTASSSCSDVGIQNTGIPGSTLVVTGSVVEPNRGTSFNGRFAIRHEDEIWNTIDVSYEPPQIGASGYAPIGSAFVRMPQDMRKERASILPMNQPPITVEFGYYQNENEIPIKLGRISVGAINDCYDDLSSNNFDTTKPAMLGLPRSFMPDAIFQATFEVGRQSGADNSFSAATRRSSGSHIRSVPSGHGLPLRPP